MTKKKFRQASKIHPTFSVSKERRSLEVLKSWQVGSVVWSDRAWCLGISGSPGPSGHDGFVEGAEVKTPTILSHPEPPLALNHPSPPSSIAYSHFHLPNKGRVFQCSLWAGVPRLRTYTRLGSFTTAAFQFKVVIPGGF